MPTKFEDLRKELKSGRILLPGEAGFDESLERWSATCIKPAAAVAQPATAEEVSCVIKFASAHGIAFNVKGGGHSTAPVSSAPSSEGMVLDLALMRSVHVDPEAKTVVFGGGCVWKEVDEALWEHGLATPGGAVSHTGVGGLILHGGFGFLSGLYGLAIDNLLSCQIVLANGDIITASETERADLCWAIRGAGSSFGVVTSFTSQAYPQEDVWFGGLTLSSNALPNVVEFFNIWERTNNGSQCMTAIFSFKPGAPGERVLNVNCVHFGRDADVRGPEYFKPLLKLEALAKRVALIPYPLLNQAADDTVARAGRRYLFGGSNFTFPFKLSSAETIQDKFFSIRSRYPTAGVEASVVFLEGIPNKKIRSVSPLATAFNNRGDYYNILLCWAWEDESIDQEFRSYNRQVQREIQRLGYNDEEYRDGVGLYTNYASGDPMEAESAFGSHASHLRDLKQKYDPQNMFNKFWKLGIASCHEPNPPPLRAVIEAESP